ncbi:MAG: 2-hydroxyacyl-CoA dehydratase [Desulfobacteraceae bacterium]|nr:2-hydroxyacyl-CoA dehydratase [Desulfobacteraceae bacterium]
MMHDHFSSIVDGITAKLEQAPGGIHARKRYALAVAKLGRRLYSGNARIAWCGVTAPFDLLNAMGVTSCFVEFVGAMLASTETAEHFIQEAEDAGYAADSCAYHRAVTGAMLKSAMPVPDFIIGTSSPCTAGLAVMENMAKAYKRDLFVLNVPQEDSPAAVRFLAGQVEEMAGFVAGHTGQALSRNRLGEALVLTNEATVLIREIYGLAKQKPSPVDSRFLRDFGVVVALFMGTREGVDICRAFRDELSHRVTTGAMDPSRERIRLMWIQNRVQYPFPMEAMLTDFGAKIVADELNDVTWEPMDPDNPFESIARRILSIPFSRNAGSRVAHLQALAREYRIDGAINPCHWGCRQGTGIRGIISNGLREIGVPVLNLEIDCVDSRNLARGQVQTRIEAFTEMIQG